MRDAVVIIGSGMMGSGIAAMAALAGHRTILVDVRQEIAQAGKNKALACIRLRAENELHTAQEAEHASNLLHISANREEALEQASMVIEAVVENLEIKQELFAQMDAQLPAHIPICSNTSGLQITKIAARCAHPERTMTTHFWLPAHLVPLVEVVMGDHTSESMARQVVEELKRWKKTPVLVRRDLPGQLANRIFQAIIREAVSIVASGLASAEDVDAAIGCGMAMRFPEWGPLTHLDAIGLKLGLDVQDSVLPSICAEKEANAYLRRLVDEGHTGAQAGYGFYDWSERDISEHMAKRDAYIMGAVKLKARVDSMTEENNDEN